VPGEHDDNPNNPPKMAMLIPKQADPGPRQDDSYSRDVPDATDESMFRGMQAVSARHKARSEARDAHFDAGGDLGPELRRGLALNRAAALRGPVVLDGVDHWWAVCVCRWSGVRHKDPELALREYDAHPCSIPLENDAPMRAQAALSDHTFVEREDGSFGMRKRPKSTMIPALAEQRTPADELALRGEHEDRNETRSTTTRTEDEAAQRFALLELK
jgi:hypothetical protein